MKRKKVNTMKIRKNFLLFVLALAISFVLEACGNSNSSKEVSSAADENETVAETLQTEEPETTEPETEGNGENMNVIMLFLHAYFSCVTIKNNI